MSKKHNYSNNVMHDIETMTMFELSKLYGIELDGDHIYDPIEGKWFKTLEEWAIYYNEINTTTNTYSKISKRNDWDDEYY